MNDIFYIIQALDMSFLLLAFQGPKLMAGSDLRLLQFFHRQRGIMPILFRNFLKKLT